MEVIIIYVNLKKRFLDKILFTDDGNIDGNFANGNYNTFHIDHLSNLELLYPEG